MPSLSLAIIGGAGLGAFIVELIIFSVLRFALAAEAAAHDKHGSPEHRQDPDAGIGSAVLAELHRLYRAGLTAWRVDNHR